MLKNRSSTVAEQDNALAEDSKDKRTRLDDAQHSAASSSTIGKDKEQSQDKISEGSLTSSLSSNSRSSSLVNIYSDGTKNIEVGHLELGLPSFHIFDNPEAHAPEDVTPDSFPLGRSDTRRELEFRYRENDERAQTRISDRIQEVDRMIQSLQEGGQEIAIRKQLEKSTPRSEDKEVKKGIKKDLRRFIQTLSVRARNAQELADRGPVESLVKSQMRSLALYAKLMGTSTQQALSLPYFHNRKRRDEFYFPFAVNSPSKGVIGGHMYPWAEDEVQSLEKLKFKSFVTAGCLFGSSLQGVDAKGQSFPLVKHDLEVYTKQKITYISNTKTSLYEQLQFIQLDVVAGIINRFASSEEDKKLTYHLPYFDYVLFGIGLFLKNQITPNALKSLFEHIYIRKEEHSKKIKEIFKAHGIINVVIESPFSNMFNVKGETSTDFVNSIYAAFPFLEELTAETKRGFHDEFIENFGNEYSEFKGFYAAHLAIKPEEKEIERPKAKEKAEKEAKEESKKTAKEKAKKTARKDAKATHGEEWEAKWTNELEKAWETQWENHLGKEWDAQWEESQDKKLWHSNWTEELEKAWEKEWDQKWEERIREKAFVSVCLDKLLNQNNNSQLKQLWQDYSRNLCEMKQIEDLFEYANPIMVASAANNYSNYETCSILPATEKQIQVGYVDINKKPTSSDKKPKVVNFTLLDSPAYASSNQYDGRAFYFTSPEITQDPCVDRINQLSIQAMRTAAELSKLPQLDGPTESEKLEKKLKDLRSEIAKFNDALKEYAISNVTANTSSSTGSTILDVKQRRDTGSSSSVTSDTFTLDEGLSSSSSSTPTIPRNNTPVSNLLAISTFK